MLSEWSGSVALSEWRGSEACCQNGAVVRHVIRMER